MSTEVLIREQREHVLTLTLNRPDRRNALSADLVEALIQAFAELDTEDTARVVVLTGAGDKAFCSGGDLDPAAAALGPVHLHEGRRRFVALLQAIRGCRCPVIARVGGHVAGGGMGLVAACDLAIAADDVHFSTPEIKVGLFPMMIMAVLARNVSRKRLLELMLTGERVTAARAAEIGLINDAVPREELDARLEALATRVASMSPVVLALGRRAFYAMEDMPFDEALEFLCTQLTLNSLTEDAAEGIMAFVGRRDPVWKGR